MSYSLKMSYEERQPNERRVDKHQQMLVDVGIALFRNNGPSYARRFLEEMNISELVIERVLSREALRPSLHLTLKDEIRGRINLVAAQRRVRAGVDSLRCPVAGQVPGSVAVVIDSLPADLQLTDTHWAGGRRCCRRSSNASSTQPSRPTPQRSR